MSSKWPATHEELYSLCGVDWPPDVAPYCLSGLRQREQEVVILAHKAFPPEGGEWEFLDANCTAERLFQWPPKNQAVALSQDLMKSRGGKDANAHTGVQDHVPQDARDRAVGASARPPIGMFAPPGVGLGHVVARHPSGQSLGWSVGDGEAAGLGGQHVERVFLHPGQDGLSGGRRLGQGQAAQRGQGGKEGAAR